MSLENVLLALADDDLVMGHRHSEWTGWAPHIEEDIAFSSIAQDEIGHATLYFGLIASETGADPDKLALGRTPGEYRHAIVCERPNRDWAYTLARHFLYEEAERIRLESLRSSSHRPLADVCVKLLREERYHHLHAMTWFRRLASGPVEGRHQFALALSEALPDALGLFEEIEGEEEAVALGLLPHPSRDLLQSWLTSVVGTIEESGLPFTLAAEDDGQQDFLATSSGELIDEHPDQSQPTTRIFRDGDRWRLEGRFPGMGGRKGRHSSDFEDLWSDLTMTYREEPSATW